MYKKTTLLLARLHKDVNGGILLDIKNKYDLLEYLVDRMDPNTKTFVDENSEIDKLIDGHDYSIYMNELRDEKLIRATMNSTFFVYDQGVQLVAQRKKERSKSFKATKKIKKAISWLPIGAIITGLLVAYLTWRLGWLK